jgi:phosphoglycerate dehydrogenase-like enzyme
MTAHREAPTAAGREDWQDATRPNALIVASPQYLDRLYSEDAIRAIQRRTQLLAPPMDPRSVAARPDLLAQVEVLFSGWNAPVLDAVLLESAPRLRAVFYAGGSVRYFVSDALWARGVTVCSAFALNGEAVADYTVGAVLFSLKQGFAHASAARRGAFAADLPVPGVHGGTVGLISLGATGRAVARKLAPFGINLVGYDPFVSAAEAEKLGVCLRPRLETVFAGADIVSLHAPLLPTTEGMITGAHLAAMRPGATFINTARGAIVRENEMIDVLRRRPDLTAILDVTDPEPPRVGSPLYSLPNVVLTPHVAGAIDRECRRMGEAMLAEFDRWRAGEPLQHAIRAEQLSTMA